MASLQPWNTLDSRRIWTAQMFCGVAAVLTEFPIAYTLTHNFTWRIFASPRLLIVCLYLFTIIIELSLHLFARLPPASSLFTNAGKLLLITYVLSRDFSHNPYQRRLYIAAPQEYSVHFLLWLVAYAGLAYAIFIWHFTPVRGRQRSQCATLTWPDSESSSSVLDTSSQFHTGQTRWSVPVQMAIWIWSTPNVFKRWPVAQRGIVPAFLILKWVPGALAITLLLAGRSPLPGEYRIMPKVRARQADDHDVFESKTSYYPRVTLKADSQSMHHGDNDLEQGLLPDDASTESPHPSMRPEDARSVHSLHDVAPSRSPEPSTIVPHSNRAITQRLLRPRHLCIVDTSCGCGYRVVSADDQQDLYTVPYVFISYTRKQFYTQIPGDSSLTTEDIVKRRAAAERDMATLISLALAAVERANVPAFWIDFACVLPETPGDADASRSLSDVYRICDIVRASHSIAIMVCPSLNGRLDHEGDDLPPAAQSSWLREWGERLWTLPEALLCPSNHGVAIYSAGAAEAKVEVIEKRNLAVYIWEDAATVGQLLDHYEGSVRLSQLELVSIALKSFQRRQTVARMSADAIYALMGLMRERLTVRADDSAFQAFARLSLINDSAMPLERLLCVRPVSSTASWHSLEDVWGAKLWDITPQCQIAEVASGDAVILGDMYGADINWGPLPPIRFLLAPSQPFTRMWKYFRIMTATAWAFGLVTVIVAVMQGVGLQFAGSRNDSDSRMRSAFDIQLAAFAISTVLLLVLSLFLSPTIAKIYRADVCKVQARFYAFHGVADLDTVDRSLFGISRNRIAWSKYNPLTRSTEEAPDGSDDSGRIFTLVDTWMMTASTFRAQNPPSVVMVCGKQGGLLRALLCSYEEHSKTFCRETVLRMETQVLERMFRMDRCKVALSPMKRYTDTELP